MKKKAMFQALLLSATVSFTTFIISYHWLSRNEVLITRNISRTDEYTNKSEENPTKSQCEAAMKSEYFETPSEYCRSSCAKNLKTKMFFRSSRMIFNDKYKFIFCPVPKVGVTNWRRILLVLSGNVKITDPLEFSLPSVHGKYYKYLSYLATLSEVKREYRLNTYYKFMFVRDPFERIVSAYNDKFVRRNRFAWSGVGKQIIKTYRQAPDKKSLKTGLGVKFHEFVHYIVDSSVYSFNEHWALMSMLCLPCSIKYHFVGHMDSMDSDSREVLEELGVSKLVQYPHRGDDHTYEESKTMLERYYRQIPREHLIKLKRIYHLDYLMFNLTFPSSLESLLN
ncbi:carbohydrate sulfotransferase 9-like [Gigantopelta aegis]|uniref:carbohydrate sulfotransferase 9-like n=1 Tax=Gigantopelta aegis TaxID=1735272 RepID=UPI001B88760A|nr:carbohydrate sulfotransferase 9-like [Gigantopelta aegis]